MLTRFAKTTLLLALAVGISLLFARCDSVSTSSPGGEDQQQGPLFEATNDLESRMTALDDTVSMQAFGLTDGSQSPKSVQDLSFTGVAQIAPPGDTTRASYLSTAGGQLHVGYKALGPAFKGGIDILDASDPTNILDVSSLGSSDLDVQEVVYDGDEDALFVAAALNPSSYEGDLQGTPSSLIKVTNLSNPQTEVAGLDGKVGKSVVKAPDGDQEHDVYAVTDQTSLYRFDAALGNQAIQEVSGAEFRSVATTQSTVFTVDRSASVYSSGVGSAGSLSEEQTIASGVGELAIGRMQARSKAVLNGDRLFLALGSEGLAVLDAETGEVLFQKSDPYYTSVSLHTDAPGVSSQPSDLVYASRLDGTIDLFRVGENGIDAGGTDTGLNEFGSLDLGALNPNSSAVAAADASNSRLDAAASANASSKQVAEQVNYVLATGCYVYVTNSQDGVVVLQIGDGQSCPIGNQPPTVNDDTDQTTQGESTTTDVLANDNDPDGLDPSTVTVENGPSDGTTSVNNGGTITYTPDDGFTGEDSYHYSVKDDEGAESENATVTITVQASTAATEGCEGAIGGGVAFTSDGDLKTVASDGGTVNELLITGPDTPVLALGTGVDVDEDGSVGVAYIQQSEGAEQTVSVIDKNDASPTNYALPVAAKSNKTLIGVGSFGGAPSFFYVGAVGNGDEIYRVNFDDGSSEPLADPENGVDAIAGVADVDGDSDKELIFSDGSQQTRYINPGDPSQASFTKLPNGGAGSNNNIGIGSCLADVDGDGRASIPIVDGSNEIDLVDATGVSKTIVMGNANEEAAKTPLAWADIDNDGDPELVYLENNNSPAELKYIDDIAEAENCGPSNFKFVENAGGGTIEADTGTGAVSAQ